MSDLFDLKGKVALVTGASSGLGVQFAKALARQGADVIIAARRVEKLEEVKKEIEALGVRCMAVKCDVAVSSEISSMVSQIKDKFGRIDILVNNAGVANAAAAEAQTDEEWRHVMSINVDSVYYVAREVGKLMIEQKYGKIINIGSIHSVVSIPAFPISSYATSKGAVLMLTKTLASEWAKYNITVNAIGPAYFLSEMTQSVLEVPVLQDTIKNICPMGRHGRPGELDGAVVYFASDASSYTTGQYLAVDGGWTAN